MVTFTMVTVDAESHKKCSHLTNAITTLSVTVVLYTITMFHESGYLLGNLADTAF